MDMKDDERRELLALYEGLRVADVRDGMDWVLLHRVGSMVPAIRPLYRTRIVGIARTARYLPYQGGIPPKNSEEYTSWSAWYYANVCTYPWMEAIRDGDVWVIDQSGVDAGLIGSNNGLDGRRRGARGYVTNGGVRDTDELILEKVPVWCAFVSQSMVQARLQFDAFDVPIAVGGVQVRPGDVVVADGDGVIVVPNAVAFEVARHARRELTQDKLARRKLYDELGLPLDESVR